MGQSQSDGRFRVDSWGAIYLLTCCASLAPRSAWATEGAKTEGPSSENAPSPDIVDPEDSPSRYGEKNGALELGVLGTATLLGSVALFSFGAIEIARGPRVPG